MLQAAPPSTTGRAAGTQCRGPAAWPVIHRPWLPHQLGPNSSWQVLGRQRPVTESTIQLGWRQAEHLLARVQRELHRSEHHRGEGGMSQVGRQRCEHMCHCQPAPSCRLESGKMLQIAACCSWSTHRCWSFSVHLFSQAPLEGTYPHLHR